MDQARRPGALPARRASPSLPSLRVPERNATFLAQSITATGKRHMTRTTFALIAATVAAAAGGLALASCSNDSFSTCHVAALDFDGPLLTVAVKDSARVRAVTVSDCTKIGRAVVFSLKDPSLANIRVISDTTIMLTGAAVGQTLLYVQPRDYRQNRDSIFLTVIGENP